ncbi:MAG: hypothetical protein NVS2B7_18420 [Herpetosiphon sp.]
MSEHIIGAAKAEKRIAATIRKKTRGETTPVLERNGGMHRQKQFRRIKAMLTGHGYKQPRLYHLVLIDDTETAERQGAARFLKALKVLCLELRQNDISTRWRACLERDDKKGIHFHVYVLVDAVKKNPCGIINKKTGKEGWLRNMLEKQALRFHLSPPKSDIHRKRNGERENYAHVSRAKLDDCIEWISYLVKARSKPDDIRGIYFSSRDSLHAPRIGPAEADPGANDQNVLQAA